MFDLGFYDAAALRVYGDGLMQGVRVLDLDDRRPRCLETRMARYRELVGKDCRSIKGRNKAIPDRWNVKIDAALKALPFAAAAGTTLLLYRIIKKK